MPKVAIVTDSIACLTRESAEQYSIKIIPLNFYAGDRLYKDWIDVTPSQSYEWFLKDPESFKTSAATPEDCLKAYHQASQQAKSIVCITLSAKMSAVYSIAQAAKEQIKTELPMVSIELVNSQTVMAAEGFVALAAAREMRDKVGARPVHVAVTHAYARDEAERLKERVSAEFNCAELWLTECSPIMGYACGTGTVGLAFYPEV